MGFLILIVSNFMLIQCTGANIPRSVNTNCQIRICNNADTGTTDLLVKKDFTGSSWILELNVNF